MTQWYFRDKVGKVQGPFDSDEMRAWYEAGYLGADLLVAKGDPRNNPFKQLVQHFPNGSNAFMENSGGAEATAGAWYFLDKNHNQQGPFTDIHMRQWHMAGYFEPTLMIINVSVPNAQWQQLKQYFPTISDAFATSVGSGGSTQPVTKKSPTANTNNGGASTFTSGGDDPRFNFPDWLPVPPRYRGVKKIYPSEKNGNSKRKVAIRDVNGQEVKTFTHAK